MRESSRTLAPIWLPHWPAWRCTISRMIGYFCDGKRRTQQLVERIEISLQIKLQRKRAYKGWRNAVANVSDDVMDFLVTKALIGSEDVTCQLCEIEACSEWRLVSPVDGSAAHGGKDSRAFRFTTRALFSLFSALFVMRLFRFFSDRLRSSCSTKVSEHVDTFDVECYAWPEWNFHTARPAKARKNLEGQGSKGWYCLAKTSK